jgi:hypothetical protein
MLGGNGIVLGYCDDLDIQGNSLNSTGLLAEQNPIAGVEIFLAMNANISDNRIQQVGPTTVQSELARFGIVVLLASGVRFSGNRITDVGPTNLQSAGIAAAVAGRLDVTGNEIRRASVPPATVDQSVWLTLWLVAEDNPIIQGNVLESFGGPGKNNDVSGAMDITATGSCIFSNNQCILDNPAGNTQIIVVRLTAPSIIALGNRVTGPASPLGTVGSSMLLNLPKPKPLAVTVIGNITSSGITLKVGSTTVPMPPAMAPLNVVA